MLETPAYARMPGSEAAIGPEDFDPGEVSGMRSAGIVLLISAIASLVALLFVQGVSLLSAGIDVVLGVQLYRLRHSWCAWAMLRAWIGLGIGLLILIGSVVAETGALALVLVGVEQLAYCVSILLLLFRAPSTRRVLAGRVTFAVAFVLLVLGVVFAPCPSRCPRPT